MKIVSERDGHFPNEVEEAYHVEDFIVEMLVSRNLLTECESCGGEFHPTRNHKDFVECENDFFILKNARTAIITERTRSRIRTERIPRTNVNLDASTWITAANATPAFVDGTFDGWNFVTTRRNNT